MSWSRSALALNLRDFAHTDEACPASRQKAWTSQIHKNTRSSNVARLSNKVAIITGGARGMGAATSRLFAAQGARW